MSPQNLKTQLPYLFIYGLVYSMAMLSHSKKVMLRKQQTYAGVVCLLHQTDNQHIQKA